MKREKRAVALESIIREWVAVLWMRGDSSRTWRRDSWAWASASMSPDHGAKAAAGELPTTVVRFFDRLGCISTLRLRGAGGLATRSNTHGINHKDCEREKVIKKSRRAGSYFYRVGCCHLDTGRLGQDMAEGFGGLGEGFHVRGSRGQGSSRSAPYNRRSFL